METAVPPYRDEHPLTRIRKVIASGRRTATEKIDRAQTQLIESINVTDPERRRQLEDDARAMLNEANETLRNVREVEREISSEMN